MTNPPPSEPLQIMSPDPAWHLLDRYFGGECTPAEVESVEQWMAEDAANARMLAQVRRVWVEGASAVSQTDADAAWHALHERIAAPRDVGAHRRPPRSAPTLMLPRRGRWGRWSVVPLAAALVGVVGTAVWWNRHVPGTSTGATKPVREYITTRGQRAELMLVDGTRVWLSVDTRLRVRPGYGAATRDVELEGEGYFRVAEDDARPFRVYTRGAVSQDLGTEFNVRAYPGESDERLLVTEGRVAMRRIEPPAAPRRAHDSTLELGRGQMGHLDPRGRLTVVDGVDPSAVIAWRDGQLRFKNTPIAEAVRELERWYDLDIVLEDTALASVPLTAILGAQTADQALAVVAKVLDARYERRDRRVRLVPSSASH
jgi:ferric-dicitrate binding protein FerR (iron transport regulator)